MVVAVSETATQITILDAAIQVRFWLCLEIFHHHHHREFRYQHLNIVNTLFKITISSCTICLEPSRYHWRSTAWILCLKMPINKYDLVLQYFHRSVESTMTICKLDLISLTTTITNNMKSLSQVCCTVKGSVVLTLIWRTQTYASFGSSFTLGSSYRYSTDNETPSPLSDLLSVQKLSVYTSLSIPIKKV